MDIGVLGPLRVRVGDGWVAFDSPKQRAILGVLAARPRRTVGSDELLEIVWCGRPPSGGVKTLRYHVSKLRDLLDPGRAPGTAGPIRTVTSGYLLNIARDALDAERFERLSVDGGRRVSNGSFVAGKRILDEALGLWRGDAWEDFRFDDFALPMIRRLDELRLTAIEDRIEARLGLGERVELISELGELTTRHPLRERLWEHLMVAHCGAGNSGGALEAYDRAGSVLSDELGVEPNDALRHLRQQIIDRSRSLGAGPAAGGPDGLPARASSFVGREADQARLIALLRRQRLVTVVGPGGVGKSSVAVETARQLNRAGEPVVFVDLSLVSDQKAVLVHLARCCGVDVHPGLSVFEPLLERLANDPHVFVLDNCEHVRDGAAPAVTALLGRAAGVRVLATSRAPLHVEGEHVFQVEPLCVPSVNDPGAIEASDAVRLFVERAAATGGFTLDARTREPVAEICRRVDGLPLAIELAAARLRALTAEELLDGLTRSFDLLADEQRPHERHRTLWATLEWSHNLLSPGARDVLAGLSVLRGVFDLAAIHAVCADRDEPGILSLLEELIDFSFLVRRHRNDRGFRLLETVRELASDQLSTSGCAPEARGRHAQYFATLTAQRLDSDAVEVSGDPFDRRSESDNRMAALDWSLEHGRPDLTVSLAAGVALDWYTQPRGEGVLRRLIAAVDQASEEVSHTRAEALRELGLTLPWIGRPDDALRVAAQLDRVARRLASPVVVTDALWVRAAIATVSGRVAESRDLFARGSSMLRSLNHRRLTIFLFDLAVRELALGNKERATELCAEIERESRVRQEQVSVTRATLLRGLIAYIDGDVDRALDRLSAALGEMRAQGLVGPQADPLRYICEVAPVAERWDLAEQAARDYESLLVRNGEIVGLPVVTFARASASLAQGNTEQATQRVVDGLEVIRRTATLIFLDDALLITARIAVANGADEQAAQLFDERDRRIADRGISDPVPVSLLMEQERPCGISPGLPRRPSHDWRELVDDLERVVTN